MTSGISPLFILYLVSKRGWQKPLLYIYICCEVIIWAKFGHFQSYYLGQVCFLKTLFAKNTIKIGVSALFFEKKCAHKFPKLSSGPSWPFLCCNKLGPDNNINLAQIITLENGHYFLFFAFENVLKYLFLQCFLNINQNLAKKRAKKNDNFSHFSKHRLLKNPFCCNSPFDQKLVFLNLCFLKPKTLMLNRKHNWIPGKKQR